MSVSVCYNADKLKPKQKKKGESAVKTTDTFNKPSVTGAKAKKSVINSCKGGYAVVYYSYATEEGMELFMPVNKNYVLNMKSCSLKPKHTVSYNAFYQSFSSNSKQRIRDNRGSFSDWFFMNSDFRQADLNMNF